MNMCMAARRKQNETLAVTEAKVRVSATPRARSEEQLQPLSSAHPL